MLQDVLLEHSFIMEKDINSNAILTFADLVDLIASNLGEHVDIEYEIPYNKTYGMFTLKLDCQKYFWLLRKIKFRKSVRDKFEKSLRERLQISVIPVIGWIV